MPRTKRYRPLTKKPDGPRPPSRPLSGYRLMWVLVMFDLPVDTDEAVKAANGFRNDLLDLGFERCQYSVYLRFVEGREQADTTTRRVQAVLPGGGKVYVLYFTEGSTRESSVSRTGRSGRNPKIRSNSSFSDPMRPHFACQNTKKATEISGFWHCGA